MENNLYNLINEVNFIQKKINKNDYEKIKLEKEKETKKKKIDELYESTITEKIDNSKAEFNKYLEISNILYDYSSFDVNILGPVLADLMSEMESEKYSYYTLEYSYKEDVGVFDHNIVDYKDTAAFISKDVESKNLFNVCYVSTNGIPNEYKHCCLLESVKVYEENNICIYKCHNKRNLTDDLCLKVDLAFSFLSYQKTYVKQFIDYVIDIRIKNKIKKINREELNLYLDEFIKNYEIQNNSSQKTKKKVKKIDK